MPISFKCSSCEKLFKVSRKLCGKKIRCNQCKGVSRVPEVPGTKVPGSASASTGPVGPIPETTSRTAPPQSAKATPHSIPKRPKRRSNDFVEIQSEWVVECDDCGRQHKPDEKLMGKRIRCKCGTVLHLTEHPNASIPMVPLEPEMVDLSQMQPYETHAGPAPVFQAPPPSFKSSPTTIREQRKRDAEDMVRAADQKQQWRSTLKEKDEEEEWGPLGKVIGGGAMMAGGGIWLWLGLQEGYLYYGSLWMLGGGAISLVVGLIESVG